MFAADRIRLLPAVLDFDQQAVLQDSRPHDAHAKAYASETENVAVEAMQSFISSRT